MSAEAKVNDKFWLAANGLFIAQRVMKDPRTAVALSWVIEENDPHDLNALLKEHAIAEAVEQTRKEGQSNELNTPNN